MAAGRMPKRTRIPVSEAKLPDESKSYACTGMPDQFATVRM